MDANGKNVGTWTVGLRVLVGASALLAGACTTEQGDDTELRAGTYAVTGLDLSSCVGDTWIKSGTTTQALVVEARGDDYVVSACSEQTGGLSCAPTSPSLYVWGEELWSGEDGGAYTVENGCLLVHVQATARLVGGELVIEAERWTSEVASGCTLEAVTAMRARPCDGRSRLYAIEQ